MRQPVFNGGSLLHRNELQRGNSCVRIFRLHLKRFNCQLLVVRSLRRKDGDDSTERSFLCRCQANLNLGIMYLPLISHFPIKKLYSSCPPIAPLSTLSPTSPVVGLLATVIRPRRIAFMRNHLRSRLCAATGRRSQCRSSYRTSLPHLYYMTASHPHFPR